MFSKHGVDSRAVELAGTTELLPNGEDIFVFQRCRMDRARKKFTEKIRAQMIGEIMEPKRTRKATNKGPASARLSGNKLVIHSK